MSMVRGIAVLASLVISGGLAACGGSDSGDGTPAATTEAATTSATTAPSDGAAADGALTPPGTTLKPGQTAHVKFKSLVGKGTHKLDVTVLGIEKGASGDFKNVKLDAAQKASTPYYVTVRIKSASGEVPVKEDDPDVRFDGVDDRGQSHNNVIFLGGFERCDDATAPTPFTKGKSYESCGVYLIPGGGSIREVNWEGADEYYSKPIVWK